MDDSIFNREYLGDNENRAWVRKTMKSKGFTVDNRKVIMLLSQPSIDIMFLSIMRLEFPDHV